MFIAVSTAVVIITTIYRTHFFVSYGHLVVEYEYFLLEEKIMNKRHQEEIFPCRFISFAMQQTIWLI